MKKTAQIEIPIQPVESPVICAPYEEPNVIYLVNAAGRGRLFQSS